MPTKSNKQQLAPPFPGDEEPNWPPEVPPEPDDDEDPDDDAKKRKQRKKPKRKKCRLGGRK